MRLSLRLSLAFSCAVVLSLGGAAPTAAVTINLAIALGNSGYETGTTSSWTATQPNTQFIIPVPVDPSIAPLDPCCTNGSTLPILLAPAGSHFVGVATDPDTVDEKGKLVHDALSQSFAADTIFQVTVWANRGRIAGGSGNTNSTFGTATPPDMLVSLYGWGSGTTPTVNSSDNWSRTRTYNPAAQSFTNWGTPGQWTSQTFTWTPGVALSYISLAIAGRNNNHDQYVAWDVPEPSTGLLLALGLAGIAFRRRSRRADK